MFISRKQINIITLVIAILVIGLCLMVLNVYELHKLANFQCESIKAKNYEEIVAAVISDSKSPSITANHRTPVAWITSKKSTNILKNLKHVVNSFKAFDYNFIDFNLSNVNEDLWDVLWAHNYPFHSMKTYFQSLKKTHCINHYPGTSFITNKVHLATSDLPYIPKAFQMPKEKEELLKFAKANPEAMFVQKSNSHRGIKIEKIAKLDFQTEETFIQQFIHNPLLVDGYKFDIGVYTAITSVNPLRIYIFDEILFRFCPEKYHPFSANISKKYVVDDDYRPTWKVPSLMEFYIEQGFGMKASFNAWLRTQNKNPLQIWDEIEMAIRSVFATKKEILVQYSSNYPRNLIFFEIVRFDFIIDDNLKVYLMEANMSPNLNSAHFTENRLLYEQVVYNLLSLVGISYKYCLSQNTTTESREMKVAFKDISVFPEHCKTHCANSQTCTKIDCQLCKPCILPDTERYIKKAFLEHTWRGSYRRIVPRPIKQEDATKPADSIGLAPDDTLMTEWFRGKCLLDSSFCY